MNLSTLSNIKRKRSNAPGNGLLTQLKLRRSSLNGVESLQLVNEKTQFKTEEEVIADAGGSLPHGGVHMSGCGD